MVPHMSSASEPRLRSSKRSGSSSASQSADGLGDEPFVRSADEQAIIDKMIAKQRASKAMPQWNLVSVGNSFSLSPEMKDHKLAVAMSLDALGLTNSVELQNVLEMLEKQATTKGLPDAKKFNRMLSHVCSIQPRDLVEAMLGVHMAIINEAISDQSESLAMAKTTMQVDSANNALNKLMRTFTEQMSALKKHRSGGPQRIIVERLEVKAGGQAFVGDGSGGVTVNDGVEMTAPQKRPSPAARLTSARKEERLEVPFSDHRGPVIDQKVAIEWKVPLPSAPAESISTSTPEPPRAPRISRVNRGPYASWKRKR